jgi:hypothetical protein
MKTSPSGSDNAPTASPLALVAVDMFRQNGRPRNPKLATRNSKPETPKLETRYYLVQVSGFDDDSFLELAIDFAVDEIHDKPDEHPAEGDLEGESIEGDNHPQAH